MWDVRAGGAEGGAPRFLSDVQRNGLLLLVLGLIAVALAYGALIAGVGEWAAPWLLALGSTSVLAGLACLGAARRVTRGARRGATLAVAIAIAFTAVAAGLILALALPPPTATGPLLLGLPRVTTLLLLLTGLVPLLLLPIAFALAFDDDVITEQDLARIRAAASPDA